MLGMHDLRHFLGHAMTHGPRALFFLALASIVFSAQACSRASGEQDALDRFVEAMKADRVEEATHWCSRAERVAPHGVERVHFPTVPPFLDRLNNGEWVRYPCAWTVLDVRGIRNWSLEREIPEADIRNYTLALPPACKLYETRAGVAVGFIQMDGEARICLIILNQH